MDAIPPAGGAGTTTRHERGVRTLSDDARRGLADEGYTVVHLLSDDQVEECHQLYQSLDVPDDRPFYASCNDAERADARRIDVELKRRVGPLVAPLLADHTPFLASFVSKGRSIGGPMAFHQDLTYVDERRYRSVTVWIPLVDVDEASGALEVVPGSHLWSDLPRPGGSAPLAATEVQGPLSQLAVTVPARRGDVVLFDSAVLHGSTQNSADRVRPAAVLAFAPDEATLVHFHQDEGGPLEAFEIDEAFFTTQPFRARPVGYPDIEPWAPALHRRDLERSLEDLLGDLGTVSSDELPGADEPARGDEATAAVGAVTTPASTDRRSVGHGSRLREIGAKVRRSTATLVGFPHRRVSGSRRPGR